MDGYMNIALEKTQEFVEGGRKPGRSYGDAFVRGNNGMLFFLLLSLSVFLRDWGCGGLGGIVCEGKDQRL